ncbi:MAG: HypC/HybG/HupF family hydrogenase formation chaperone [Nanoarchaeota archaeon]|nr:HypC/HybG/HupF family hydrogenase formation chaperone [Nanoarchaeota archaeon]
MCLTIPGRIIKIEGDIATLDYGSEKREAKIVEGDYKIGDCVLVQAKIVVEKVSEEQMAGWLEVLKDIEERDGA